MKQLYPNSYLAELLLQLKIQRNYVKGEGAWLEDGEGRRVLDFLAGYGSLPFGHNPTRINNAVIAAMGTGRPVMVQMSNSEISSDLVRRLLSIVPPDLKHVVFANSGTEAIEASIKAARSATKRSKIVTANNGFHGKTLGALAATGQPHYQEGFFVSRDMFYYVDYDDLNALDCLLASERESIAAVLLEPIQGEGGVIVPSSGYLRGVRELCDKYELLMIVDEIQTGLGRTGVLFECLEAGVTPDCITVAKTLGGGVMPIGACIMNDKIYQRDFAMRHTSTFAGNGMACVVGSAVIDYLLEDDKALLKHVNYISGYLRQKIDEVLSKYRPALDIQLRGKGLMLGLHFDVDEGKYQSSSPLLNVIMEAGNLVPILVSYLLNIEGVRVAPTLNGKNVLRVQPPFTIDRQECDFFSAALDRGLSHLTSGKVSKLVECFC